MSKAHLNGKATQEQENQEQDETSSSPGLLGYQSIRISKIKVKRRMRKDLGNLSKLKKSDYKEHSGTICYLSGTTSYCC